MGVGVGNLVRVKKLADPQRDLMYSGWLGVVVRVSGEEALVDSDAAVKRANVLQAVSFKEWFKVSELEVVAT